MSQSKPNKHSLNSNNKPTNLYPVICCTYPKVKSFLCTIRINRGYQATNDTQSTNQSGTMMVPVYSWDTTLCVYIYIYRWGDRWGGLAMSLACFWGSGRAIVEHDQGHFHKAARWTIQQGDIARQKSCWLLQYTSKTMEWLVGYRGVLIHKNGGYQTTQWGYNMIWASNLEDCSTGDHCLPGATERWKALWILCHGESCHPSMAKYFSPCWKER